MGFESKILFRQQSRDAPVREVVGAFIPRMSGVAFDPMPVDAVPEVGGQRIEASPQVHVFHAVPATASPARHPFRHASPHVLAVRPDVHGAGAFEGLQRPYGRREFHAVVRGLGFAAVEFLFTAVRQQKCAPTAGAGVALAGPVNIDGDAGENRGCGKRGIIFH